MMCVGQVSNLPGSGRGSDSDSDVFLPQSTEDHRGRHREKAVTTSVILRASVVEIII